MSNIAPTKGRIVYFKNPVGDEGEFNECAAIITEVQEAEDTGTTLVQLCVFSVVGMSVSGWVTQGESVGQWDWMPFQKDQQARLATDETVGSKTTA